MRKSPVDAKLMDLGRLLDLIHEGTLALPDFQRDFDWSTEDVESLLVTVLSSWPAGSLLLMEGGRHIFEVRGLEDGPPLASKQQFVLLDGQQRLTSLYYALYDVGPRVYAVRIGGISDLADLEDAVVSYIRSEWESQFSSEQSQAKARLVPFSSLVTATAFFEWRDAALEGVASSEGTQLRRELTSAYSDYLSAIHGYQFPAVILEKTIAPQAIARIFERVNRLGMPLNTFDLMVARVFEPDWNLRHKWEEALQEWPVLEVFEKDDGMPVLQVIALRAAENVRRSAVLDLERRVVHQEWDDAARGVATAGEFLQAECGVSDQKFLPYRTLLLLIGAIATDYDIAPATDRLSTLFWSKAFAQSYDAAANTRVVTDHANLVRHFETGATIPMPTVDPTVLYQSARRTHRAVWAAFVSLMEALQPRGFLARFINPMKGSAAGIRKKLIHVVPRGLEPEAADLAPPHLRVLSLVNVEASWTGEVRSSGLVDVLEGLAEIHGSDAVDEELRCALLPPLDVSRETMVDWRAFFAARLEVLTEELESRGVLVQADVEQAT